MPNIASVLKSEIVRLARKEVRSEVAGAKKAVASSRSEIAALKKRVRDLEVQLRTVAKSARSARVRPEPEASAPLHRFSAKGLASQRRRLGLSAVECGLLIGASGQSVYNWESGKARPRASLMPAIGALRKLGRKAATARLAELSASG